MLQARVAPFFPDYITGTPMVSLLNEIARAGFGYGLTAKKEYGIGDRISGFLVLARPIFFILTPINAAGAAVLGLGGFPSWSQCILGFFTVAFASATVNILNDYIDRDRDRHIWQYRPLPSGRVRPNEALVLVAVLFATSLAVSWFFFNPTTFFILILALVSGSLYSIYLRDRIGYLSLPPIVGLIYLGGWAAFSPETLFSSFLPWYLYLLGVVWQAAHIMIYYPLHVTGNTNGRQETKVPPALFFKPSPETAAGIGTGFICLTIMLSVLLPLLAPLGAIYLIPVIAAGIYALSRGLMLVRDAQNREKGLKAFASLSIFRLIISAAILASVLVS